MYDRLKIKDELNWQVDNWEQIVDKNLCIVFLKQPTKVENQELI